MQLQFVNGWVLFLIWAVPALGAAWLLLYQRRRKALEKFVAEPMLAKLSPATRPARFYWQAALILAGLLFLLIAAARPQWGAEERIVFQRGRDLIVALDVSRSMLARDVHPSRLLRAKADIQDLLRELRGDRVGLIAFRGRAVQLCPLTTDYAYLEQILDEVTVESAPRGETNIGDAVEKALTAFESDEGSHRAMIIISDGEDLAGRAKAAAEKAKARGIVIFTVGLGDPKGAKIPGTSRNDPYLSYQGKEIISKLQHETLKEMADITGGAYVPVGIANVQLGKLYSEHLSKITARDLEESLQKRMIERYQFFLFPGILALLAGALLSRGRLATRKKQAGPANAGQTVFFPNVRSSRLLIALICLIPAFQGGDASPRHPAFGRLGPRLRQGLCRGEEPSLPIALAVRPYLNSFPICQIAPALPATNPPAVSAKSGQSATISNAPAEAGKSVIRLEKDFPTGRQGATKAQGLYRRGAYDQAALGYLRAVSNSSPRLQNDCLFNAAGAFYRAGNYANAAETLNQLASREESDPAKVNYNLGCATYRLAEKSEKTDTNRPPEMKTFLLEKAGAAFQRSLRAKPDRNSSDNLAVITNILPKAREEARMQALMAKYGNLPPPQLADTLLENQRNIVTALTAALTNSTPGRIGEFEALAEQEKNNADILIPLKISLANALQSQGPAAQQQIGQLDQHIEATRNSMNEGFQNLRDIDNRAYQPVRASEHGIYNLWKGLASFEKLLQEDIRRQTNTITMTTAVLNEKEENIVGASLAKPVQKARLAESAERAATSPSTPLRALSLSKGAAPTGILSGQSETILPEQNEAHELTGLFTNRFAQAVPPEGTGSKKLPGLPSAPMPFDSAQGRPDEKTKAQGTNEAPRITAEIRTNILALAGQALEAQELAGRRLAVTNLAASLPEQRRSYDLLKEIEKLLPKDKNKQDNQQNQQNDQQKQDQQQKDQDKQKDQQKPPEQKPPEQQPPPPKEDEQKKDQQKEKPQPAEQKDQKEMTPEQLRALLEKALEREKEHREQKMRDEYIPPSPVERDW